MGRMHSRQGVAATAFALATVITVVGCSFGGPIPSVTVTAEPEPAPEESADSVGSEDDSTSASASSPPDYGGVDVHVIEHAGTAARVVTLPLDQWDVRIDWEPGGTMLAEVIEADRAIQVATNAGIFTEEVVPGGLLVSDGEELVRLNLNEGGGNFHLMPNAVFAVRDDGTATVVNSLDYEPEGVLHATQSGPALLLDGEIHHEFREGSSNYALRSGVGVSPDGRTVYLVLSGWTNLWDFATLFRDELGVEDALYLDGQISHLWVTGMETPGVLAGPYAGIITAREK